MNELDSRLMPRVCTVILNWNQPAMTVDCARTTLAQEVPGGQSVLVIDNGSTAENRAALRANLPAGCVLVQNERNLGFAGGMNVGIRYALNHGYEYVWLLNNDAFPGAGCLALLVASMDADSSLGAVSPRLVFPDGSPQIGGGYVDLRSGLAQAAVSGTLPHKIPESYYITGAALFVRCRALKEIGGFDPRFFAYWEEVDLCLRLSNCGRWGLAEELTATCVHLESVTAGRDASPFKVHLGQRNRWLLIRKHTPVYRWPGLFLRLCADIVLQAGYHRSRGQHAAARAALNAVPRAFFSRYFTPRNYTRPVPCEDFIYRHYWGVASVLQRLARCFGGGGTGGNLKQSPQGESLTDTIRE